MKSESEIMSGSSKGKVEMKSESERMSVGQIREFDGGSRVAQVLPYPGTRGRFSCAAFSSVKRDELNRVAIRGVMLSSAILQNFRLTSKASD